MATRPRTPQPDPTMSPQAGQDPLAGVDHHDRRAPQLTPGAVKAKPSGRTSSGLDRPSTPASVQPHPNHHNNDNDNDNDIEDRSALPATDRHSAVIIDLATQHLAELRSPHGTGDPGAIVSCLLSLREETDSRLPDAVADARDHGYSWDDIALRLATSPNAVRRRYSAYTRWRTTQPPDTPPAAGSPALIPRKEPPID
jgi:hypothetical protein